MLLPWCGPVRRRAAPPIGHVCIWVAVIAAAAAIIGYVAWVRFPGTRNTRLIKQLWTAFTVLGVGALLGVILRLT